MKIFYELMIVCNPVADEKELLGALIDRCVRQWGIDVLKTKNCMGHTAETLAIKNHKTECAK